MPESDVQNVQRSKWPHTIAVVLVCATFPLIWVGGLVTTYDAGMAVPDWPTTYGYNMFLYPVTTWVSGPWDLFIEHGHRLLGSFAGILTIVLNVAIWKSDSRPWMRWMGAAVLLLVVSQGLLGGMRVRMNSTDLARAHGCTGPLFFAFTVAAAIMTSRNWFSPVVIAANNVSRKLLIGSWALVGLTYLQLIFGAHLRHPNVNWSPALFRTIVLFHVVAALLLAAQAIALTRHKSTSTFLRRPALLLATLVGCQVLLGIMTWRAKYGWPSFVPMMVETNVDQPFEIALHNALIGGTVQSESMLQALTVTGHVALGSLILAVAVCHAVRASRCYVGNQMRTGTSSANVNRATQNTLSSIAAGSIA